MASFPAQVQFKQHLDLQTELDIILTTDAEWLLLHTRSSYHEYGDKASRLMAHQLRRQAGSRLIPQIQDSSGNLISDPEGINAVFKSYYSTLYSSESPSDSHDLISFLRDLNVIPIDTAAAADLDAPLDVEEIKQAIKMMQCNKEPGPDGFPVEFFKKFQSKLVPLLLNVYVESLEKGFLPETLTQASIILLLKKDKDPKSCSSYRQNVDAKILAKVLAFRLETILPKIISEEQRGFIRGRQLYFNVRTLLNVMHCKHSAVTPEVVITFDAEKASDRVEWKYLFAVLQKCGFRNEFISWIYLFYMLLPRLAYTPIT